MKKVRSYHGPDQGWLTYEECRAAALPEILGRVN